MIAMPAGKFFDSRRSAERIANTDTGCRFLSICKRCTPTRTVEIRIAIAPLRPM